MKQTPLDMADMFCGAGGTSTGVLQAAQELGIPVNLVALNHWELAIATHSENHPGVNHYNADLSNVDPREAVPSGKLRLLVASPECTHFSRARGGKPMSKQSRASAKYILRWAKALDIEDILIENVPDFLDWGPLDPKTLRPVKERKGEYFFRFTRKLEEIGYTVAWRILNAADYGDPTTRKRLFVIARKHQPVRFPEPTHHKDGGDMFGSRPRWRSAREIIDWSVKGESIFKRKKPLAENTLRRIHAGLMKYGGKAFVLGQQSGAVARDIDQPIPTIATAGKISFIEPFLVPFFGERDGQSPRTHSINEPLPAVTSQGAGALVEPFLVEYHGGPDSERRNRSVDQPLPTLDTSNRFGLVEPFIMQMDQGGRLHDMDKPMPTITSADAFAVVEPFIITTNWTGTNRSQPRSVDEPVPTVMGQNNVALVEPFLVEYYGTGASSSLDEPMKTLTGRDRFALVEPMTFFQDGKKYLLDVRFRMLQPHELARAMSFPEDYHFKGTREQIVKQIGNAVPVSLAKQLAKTLLAEPAQ